ncbi:hypothetical protein [Vibrio owensii]|uniref:hypothetical protein n=1 Tax=Vibrio owensii TaxID=696485 RepID=UPI0018F182C9|nr:hypothetical protein [Vibrio owensii]
MRKNYVYWLLCCVVHPLYASPLPGVTSESLTFKVLTTINKAKLSDYTIEMRLSQENVSLSYNPSEEKFDDATVFITNQSDIPAKTESKDFQYRYTITDFHSACHGWDKEGNAVPKYDGFAQLFIDGKEYAKKGDLASNVTPSFAFDDVDAAGFRRSEDTLTLRTGTTISKEVPVACAGQVSMQVELAL